MFDNFSDFVFTEIEVIIFATFCTLIQMKKLYQKLTLTFIELQSFRRNSSYRTEINNKPETMRTTMVERSNAGDHCAAIARLLG